MTFTNHTKNQEIIHALIKGQTVQLRGGSIPEWYDFDLEFALENEDPFGPWNCADCYEWRIKPKETEVQFDFEKVVIETVSFKFEGVKNELYKVGETACFIVKHDNNLFYKHIVKNVNHNQFEKYKNYVFFISEEYLEKAWQQIPQQMKGN